jgi:hypothetical protein
MYHNVLLSIDELFDVRTTVWRELVGDQAFVKMLDECYAIRVSDRFDKFVPYKNYLEKYNERDAATVRKSTVTTLIPVIQQLLERALNRYAESPITSTPTLIIHVPPRYEFSEDELLRIKQAIGDALKLKVDITILKTECVSIKKLDELRVGSFFVYDLLEWLTTMATTHVIDHSQLSPATTVATANVHTSDQPYDKGKVDTANQTLRSEMRVAFNLEFFPASLFTSPLLTSLHLTQAPQN